MPSIRNAYTKTQNASASYLTCSEDSVGYRFGFNSMPKDNEINGPDGSGYDFGARIYDSKLGRFLSMDPQQGKQPGWSPYKAFLDNPNLYVDPDGEKEIITLVITDKQTGNTLMLSKVTSNKIFSQRGKNWSGNCDPCKTYNWYDKQIVMNVTLDNGKLLLDGVQSKLVNKKNGTTIVDNELIAQGIIFINSGEGGKFKGGWNLVSEGGGHDETKFTALNHVESINIDLLLLAVSNGGLLGKGPLPELPNINDPLGAAEFLDKFKDLVDENRPDKNYTKKNMTNGALEKSSGGYPARFDVTNKKTGESMGVRINSEKDSLKYSKENNVTRIKPKE